MEPCARELCVAGRSCPVKPEAARFVIEKMLQGLAKPTNIQESLLLAGVSFGVIAPNCW